MAAACTNCLGMGRGRRGERQPDGSAYPQERSQNANWGYAQPPSGSPPPPRAPQPYPRDYRGPPMGPPPVGRAPQAPPPPYPYSADQGSPAYSPPPPQPCGPPVGRGASPLRNNSRDGSYGPPHGPPMAIHGGGASGPMPPRGYSNDGRAGGARQWSAGGAPHVGSPSPGPQVRSSQQQQQRHYSPQPRPDRNRSYSPEIRPFVPPQPMLPPQHHQQPPMQGPPPPQSLPAHMRRPQQQYPPTQHPPPEGPYGGEARGPEQGGGYGGGGGGGAPEYDPQGHMRRYNQLPPLDPPECWDERGRALPYRSPPPTHARHGGGGGGGCFSGPCAGRPTPGDGYGREYLEGRFPQYDNVMYDMSDAYYNGPSAEDYGGPVSDILPAAATSPRPQMVSNKKVQVDIKSASSSSRGGGGASTTYGMYDGSSIADTASLDPRDWQRHHPAFARLDQRTLQEHQTLNRQHEQLQQELRHTLQQQQAQSPSARGGAQQHHQHQHQHHSGAGQQQWRQEATENDSWASPRDGGRVLSAAPPSPPPVPVPRMQPAASRRAVVMSVPEDDGGKRHGTAQARGAPSHGTQRPLPNARPSTAPVQRRFSNGKAKADEEEDEVEREEEDGFGTYSGGSVAGGIEAAEEEEYEQPPRGPRGRALRSATEPNCRGSRDAPAAKSRALSTCPASAAPAAGNSPPAAVSRLPSRVPSHAPSRLQSSSGVRREDWPRSRLEPREGPDAQPEYKDDEETAAETPAIEMPDESYVQELLRKVNSMLSDMASASAAARSEPSASRPGPSVGNSGGGAAPSTAAADSSGLGGTGNGINPIVQRALSKYDNGPVGGADRGAESADAGCGQRLSAETVAAAAAAAAEAASHPLPPMPPPRSSLSGMSGISGITEIGRHVEEATRAALGRLASYSQSPPSPPQLPHQHQTSMAPSGVSHYSNSPATRMTPAGSTDPRATSPSRLHSMTFPGSPLRHGSAYLTGEFAAAAAAAQLPPPPLSLSYGPRSVATTSITGGPGGSGDLDDELDQQYRQYYYLSRGHREASSGPPPPLAASRQACFLRAPSPDSTAAGGRPGSSLAPSMTAAGRSSHSEFPGPQQYTTFNNPLAEMQSSGDYPDLYGRPAVAAVATAAVPLSAPVSPLRGGGRPQSTTTRRSLDVSNVGGDMGAGSAGGDSGGGGTTRGVTLLSDVLFSSLAPDLAWEVVSALGGVGVGVSEPVYGREPAASQQQAQMYGDTYGDYSSNPPRRMPSFSGGGKVALPSMGYSGGGGAQQGGRTSSTAINIGGGELRPGSGSEGPHDGGGGGDGQSPYGRPRQSSAVSLSDKLRYLANVATDAAVRLQTFAPRLGDAAQELENPPAMGSQQVDLRPASHASADPARSPQPRAPSFTQHLQPHQQQQAPNRPGSHQLPSPAAQQAHNRPGSHQLPSPAAQQAPPRYSVANAGAAQPLDTWPLYTSTGQVTAAQHQHPTAAPAAAPAGVQLVPQPSYSPYNRAMSPSLSSLTEEGPGAQQSDGAVSLQPGGHYWEGKSNGQNRGQNSGDSQPHDQHQYRQQHEQQQHRHHQHQYEPDVVQLHPGITSPAVRASPSASAPSFRPPEPRAPPPRVNCMSTPGPLSTGGPHGADVAAAGGYTGYTGEAGSFKSKIPLPSSGGVGSPGGASGGGIGSYRPGSVQQPATPSYSPAGGSMAGSSNVSTGGSSISGGAGADMRPNSPLRRLGMKAAGRGDSDDASLSSGSDQSDDSGAARPGAGGPGFGGVLGALGKQRAATEQLTFRALAADLMPQSQPQLRRREGSA